MLRGNPGGNPGPRVLRKLNVARHDLAYVRDFSPDDIEQRLAYHLRRIRAIKPFRIEDEVYRCSGDAVFETTRALPKWR